MIPPPEFVRIKSRRVACDGSGNGIPAALGHPLSWLEIDDLGYVDCGYCDRRFVFVGGVADTQDIAGDIEPRDEDDLGR